MQSIIFFFFFFFNIVLSWILSRIVSLQTWRLTRQYFQEVYYELQLVKVTYYWVHAILTEKQVIAIGLLASIVVISCPILFSGERTTRMLFNRCFRSRASLIHIAFPSSLQNLVKIYGELTPSLTMNRLLLLSLFVEQWPVVSWNLCFWRTGISKKEYYINHLHFDLQEGTKKADDNKSDLLYTLYGLVEHSGTMNGGHYVAYVKVRN